MALCRSCPRCRGDLFHEPATVMNPVAEYYCLQCGYRIDGHESVSRELALAEGQGQRRRRPTTGIGTYKVKL